jgi:hypothetical protein
MTRTHHVIALHDAARSSFVREPDGNDTAAIPDKMSHTRSTKLR